MSIKRVITRSIEDNQITSEKIADGAITFAKIASEAVDASKIASGSVNASKIADDSVTSSKIIDGAIGLNKLAANSVNADKIIDGSVTSDKLATEAVATSNIAAGAVTNTRLGPSSVSSANISDGAVITVKIADTNITAAKLSGAQTGAAPIYGARAWVNFNGTGTVAIRASGNVSSITDGGTGVYTVNFTTAMPDANYSVTVTARRTDANNANFSAVLKGTTSANTSYPFSTTSCEVICGTPSNNAFVDSDVFCVAVFR